MSRSNIARQWYDQDGVDVIVDVPTSSVALAVSEITTREEQDLHRTRAPRPSDLTGAKCSPNTVHWTYDTWALAHGTGSGDGRRRAARPGSSSPPTMPSAMRSSATPRRWSRQAAARCSARSRIRSRAPDFSSFLLQAQASGAKVIGLANAGGDTINSIKQAAEFGITQGGQKLAGLLVFITDVHALGLKTAQGLVLTEAFYWDLNDGTRAWSKRFAGAQRRQDADAWSRPASTPRCCTISRRSRRPSGKDAAAVMAKMKEMPTDDPLFGKGKIRADGRKIHDMYLFQVKKPAESKGPWDYYKPLGDHPGRQGLPPARRGGCPLVQTQVIRAGTRRVTARLETLTLTEDQTRMFELLGIPPQALFGQLLLGLINGSFYAMLSLGLAVIFGLLNIINFTHGAQYMMGAFVAWMLLNYLGINYWAALVLAPIIVGAYRRRDRAAADLAALPSRPSLRPAADLRPRADHPGPVPQPVRRLGPALCHPRRSSAGGQNLGFMFLPNYRAWVVVASLVVCLATWFVIEKTKLGAYLRAATENPDAWSAPSASTCRG